MARSLEGRVNRLECSRMGPCPECGWDGDWSNAEIEVVWHDLGGSGEPEEERGPEHCSECGHQLEYVVTWADLGHQEDGL